MKLISIFWLAAILLNSCKNVEKSQNKTIGSRIAIGQMPNLAVDRYQRVHLVYGIGDSIMYTFSTDRGNEYTAPVLVATLPNLVASNMRGPQISASDSGITIIACNRKGDIFSFCKDQKSDWTQTARVNDIDTVAKEGFLVMGADGENVFVAWLDLRGKYNKIYGAKSSDGGKNWSKNLLVYASPDSTVCECCKPSLAMRGENVYVMFRNWLNGNRDLYLVHSSNGGNSFGHAQKLGQGNWRLNGCPMDGGGLVLNEAGMVQTIWRRGNKIFVCEPGKPEKEVGTGKSCAIASIGNNYAYAWTEKDAIVCLIPNGKKEFLGKGMLPVLATISDNNLICIWENEKEIYRCILQIL